MARSVVVDQAETENRREEHFPMLKAQVTTLVKDGVTAAQARWTQINSDTPCITSVESHVLVAIQKTLGESTSAADR